MQAQCCSPETIGDHMVKRADRAVRKQLTWCGRTGTSACQFDCRSLFANRRDALGGIQDECWAAGGRRWYQQWFQEQLAVGDINSQLRDDAFKSPSFSLW